MTNVFRDIEQHHNEWVMLLGECLDRVVSYVAMIGHTHTNNVCGRISLDFAQAMFCWQKSDNATKLSEK